MKTIKRILSIFIMAIMIMSMCVPAFAFDDYYAWLETINVTIDKHLIMDQYATIPTVDFRFEVENGPADEANGIKAGVRAEDIIIGDVSFTIDTPTQTANSSLNTSDYWTEKLQNGEVKDAIVEFTIDFSAFAAMNPGSAIEDNISGPGIYRYILREVHNSSNPSIMFDESTTRYLDVYVENNDNPFIPFKMTAIIVSDEDGTKSADGFVNGYKTYDLNLQNLIAGAMADMNEKFDFNIQIDTTMSEYATDTTYTMTTTNDIDVSDMNTTSGKGETNVELGNNDKITLHALPYGTKITITTENGDYVATYTVNGSNNDGATLSNHEITDDVNIVFTNAKNSIVPTGVMTSAGPLAALAIFPILGVAYILFKKRYKRV